MQTSILKIQQDIIDRLERQVKHLEKINSLQEKIINKHAERLSINKTTLPTHLKIV